MTTAGEIPVGPNGSLVDVVRHWASAQPNDRAFVFLSERGSEHAVLTFAGLETRARAVAGTLAGRAQKGDRALLVFPPGLAFIEAFFGCLMAGVIAVPMMVPRRTSSQDSSAAILADCAPKVAMTTTDLAAVRPDVIDRLQRDDLEWLMMQPTSIASTAPEAPLPEHAREDIALLQYTSGSTSSPKGVMVSHGNLLANLEMIRIRLGNTRASTCVSWVPLYHDMGLILNAIQAHYVGALCVLMAPVSFIQRPLAWLQAIHAYRGEVSSAPNFAFDLCVSRFRADQMDGIDLSSWKVAVNAAEPVRADTIARFTSTFRPYGFAASAMRPLYGLAEATLLVSCNRRGAGQATRAVSRDALQRRTIGAPLDAGDRQILVGCGHSAAGEQIAIVDPESSRRLGPNCIGEIWVAGANVARGYWQKDEATASTFRARIHGEGQEPWLRTGDLGFLDADGELYVTGRIKDVIIIRGMNYYPQDIEHSMQNAHSSLRRHCGAAFTISDENDGERLILVQEIERDSRHAISVHEIAGCIREAVFNEHEIAVHEVVLIRPGSLPKTTSGKVQRSLARKLWQQDQLEVVT